LKTACKICKLTTAINISGEALPQERNRMAGKSRKEQIEQMLQGDPNDAELRYMLAMEHASLGEDPEAVRCFNELMSRCPEYAPGFHQGARALLRLGRVEEAQEVLRKGIPVALRQRNDHAAGEMQELLDSLE
jgi:tetratricopeptide (TPR) repeat protein